MDVFDLLAKLTLDTSGYEGGLNSARDSADKGGSKIGAALGTAGKMAGAALAAATTAAVGFGAASVATGAEFDKSMSQVAATMGYTTAELNDSTSEASQNFTRLRDFAQEMGSTTAFSASQAADALNYMALAGYDTEKSIEMLPSVLDLAASGSMDLARASDMVTDTQSALGLTTEETSTLIDQMAKTASKSNTSVEQLGDAMLTIGATARNVAGGTTELSTVLGVLADNGIKGAEGGTHLRNMILSLQNPTDKGAAALEQLGVSVYDADGNMRSMIDIVEDLQAGLGEMDQAAQNAALNEIFNKTDLAAVNALLNTQSERFDELTTAIEGADGAAKNMAETQLDNLAGDVTKFQSALEGAKITLSDQLTPTLRNFVQFGTEGISRLTIAFKEGGLSGAMNELGSIIGDFIGKISENLPKIVEAGANLMMSLLEGIVKNLPKLAEAAVQIVTMLANGLAERLPQLMETAAEVITQLVSALTNPETLNSLLEAGLNIVVALADGIMKAVPKLLEALPELIHNIVAFFISAIPTIAEAGFKLFSSIVENMPNIITAIVNVLPDLITGIVTGLLDGIPMMIEGGVKLLSSIVSDLPKIIANIVQAVPKIIAGLVEGFVNNAGKLVESGLKLIGSLIEGLLQAIPLVLEIGPKIIQGLAEGIIGSLKIIVDAGKKIADSIKDAIKGAISAARQWGSDLIRNFTDGIKSSLSGLWNTVSGIAGKIKSFLGFSEPEEGPLSDFHTYAPDMMKLFAKGIKDNEHLITDQLRESFDFGSMIVPARGFAGGIGASGTTNTYNITVNGIEELEDMLRWYESRQVRARMA